MNGVFPPHLKSTPFLLKTNSQQPRIGLHETFNMSTVFFLNSVLYDYFSKMLSLYGRIKRQKQTLSSKQHSHLPYPQEINSWGGGAQKVASLRMTSFAGLPCQFQSTDI